MYQFPIIRLELEHMKQTMITALNDYQTDVSGYVQKELSAVIENFDYGAVVSEIAAEALQKGIENYFRWGEGRKIIEASIQSALDKAFGTEK